MSTTPKKQKAAKSIADRILEFKTFLNSPRTAEEIQKEIKDKSGYRLELQDIRVNLLYLLRREKIKRDKDGSVYRYHN